MHICSMHTHIEGTVVMVLDPSPPPLTLRVYIEYLHTHGRMMCIYVVCIHILKETLWVAAADEREDAFVQRQTAMTYGVATVSRID